MDNSNQNQSPDQVQFDSQKINEIQEKHKTEVRSGFRTRLTFKDKMKKFGDKPSMRGPRKFIWLAGILIIIAGVVVGAILLVNLNSGEKPPVEGSEEWLEELDDEILSGFESNDFGDVIGKIDASIVRAKEAGNNDLIRQLYNEKGYIYLNSSRYKEAAAMYQELIDILGEDGNTYNSLANSQRMAGDVQSAIESYYKAIELLEDEGDRAATEALVKMLEEQNCE